MRRIEPILRRAECLSLLAGVLLTAGGLAAQQHESPRQHGSQHLPEGSAMKHGRHNPDGMKHSFEDAERWSAVFDDPQRDAWQKPDEVIRLMAVEPGMTVADLGAGTGYFLAPLARAVGDGGRVLGLDVEPEMVEFMTRRAKEAGWDNVTARVIPGDAPELGQATVDRVLIVNTWHHLGGRTRYARLLAEALRSGGQIFVVDYDLDSPDGPPPEFRLPPQQIVEELEADSDLEAEIVNESLPHQFIVRARRK